MPERGRDEFFRWMENIEPWCISRQLWWGHQIPAWYGPDGKVFVALSEGEARAEARKHYGKDVALERDPDVLDTWFSSALWPFSTLGWPDADARAREVLPDVVLVTGYDILFFWVARMMMMGMHFMERGAVPHRLPARAGDGREGPEDVEVQGQRHRSPGADRQVRRRRAALHHGLDGRHQRPAACGSRPARVEGSRNFATKLWNATRFAEMNGAALPTGFDPATAKLTVNKWMLGELARANARDRQGARGVPAERGGDHALRIHLGHRLRLVRRAHQADPAGRRRRRRRTRPAPSPPSCCARR